MWHLASLDQWSCMETEAQTLVVTCEDNFMHSFSRLPTVDAIATSDTRSLHGEYSEFDMYFIWISNKYIENFNGELDRNSPVGRTKMRREDHIAFDLTEPGFGDMKRTKLSPGS
jgi:hypothetical protein